MSSTPFGPSSDLWRRLLLDRGLTGAVVRGAFTVGVEDVPVHDQPGIDRRESECVRPCLRHVVGRRPDSCPPENVVSPLGILLSAIGVDGDDFRDLSFEERERSRVHQLPGWNGVEDFLDDPGDVLEEWELRPLDEFGA